VLEVSSIVGSIGGSACLISKKTTIFLHNNSCELFSYTSYEMHLLDDMNNEMHFQFYWNLLDPLGFYPQPYEWP
jgi:hypothetical protein